MVRPRPNALETLASLRAQIRVVTAAVSRTVTPIVPATSSASTTAWTTAGYSSVATRGGTLNVLCYNTGAVAARVQAFVTGNAPAIAATATAAAGAVSVLQCPLPDAVVDSTRHGVHVQVQAAAAGTATIAVVGVWVD